MGDDGARLPAGVTHERADGARGYRDGSGDPAERIGLAWRARGVATVIGPLGIALVFVGWPIWVAAIAMRGAAMGASMGALVAILVVSVAMGALFGYVALIGLVNRTVVTITRVAIERRVAPLPWLGGGPQTRAPGGAIAVRARGSTRGRSYEVVHAPPEGDELQLFRGIRAAEDAEALAAIVRDAIARAAS